MQYRLRSKSHFLCMLSSLIMEKRRSSLHLELTNINKQVKEYYRNKAKNTAKQQNLDELDNLLKKQKILLDVIGKTNFEHSSSREENFIMSNILVDVKRYVRDILISVTSINRLIKKIEIGHIEKGLSEKRQIITVHYTF